MREFVYKPALTKIAGLSVREALMKSIEDLISVALNMPARDMEENDGYKPV
jgi:hypothetical protein